MTDSKIIMSPMIAKMIVFRDFSNFSLSPPDVIHEIPPNIKKNSEASIPIANRRESPKLMISANVILLPSMGSDTTLSCPGSFS